MPGHLGLTVAGVASLLTAVVPTAYTLGATQHAAPVRETTPDLAPAPPANDGQRLERSDDGFFYATVNINGHRVRLLVDTGASAIMLSAREARRMGVKVDDFAFDGRLQTSSGVVRMARATIDRIDIGGQTFADVPAMIVPGGDGLGLMGQSMLERFRSVSIEGDVLALR
ncbi:TIGR02281 family clan AA aspartic protease [Sphingomonas sp. BIUV-7]|uniref:TIGR02281 family clan AA aspartic protease n=1 Tax=Sphingomonas natans TaxID=3063330 RepID=A0ABT8Y5V4_9SPHN|nr:TIGR02281 family clan AA aspartic protease [Sphingomonas sp. BIUV-7]MDO6413708.1 TIGR02281 family clan AA aspartic protease [Sphingomonas sp. BIUV-7]